MSHKNIKKTMTGSSVPVAIVEPVGGHGGMDYYDISLCSTLSVNDITPILFTCDETDTNNYKLNFKVIKTFKKNIYGDHSKLIRGFRFLYSLIHTSIIIKKEKIKLTHLHFFHITLMELLTIIVLTIFRLKQIITMHDISSFHGKNNQLFARIIFKIIDSIIVHNKLSKDKINKFYPKIERKISIIPHGNYLNYVKLSPKPEAVKKLNLKQNCKYILFFGQIKRVKGLDILIKSLSIVKKNNFNCKLIIAGKIWKDDFSVYETLIKKLDLSKCIINHIRYIPNEEVYNYFNASDMVILPYRKIFQSGVLLMALSYRKPVIVSNLQGMTDIVTHGHSGLTFRNGDHRELAKCIINLLQNKSLADKIALNGYSRIEKEYNWNNIGKLTAKLYKQIFI